MNNGLKPNGIVALSLPVIAGVGWGTAGLFVRGLTADGMNLVTMLGTRIILSMVVLLMFMAFYKKGKLLKVKIIPMGLFAITGISGTLVTQFFYSAALNELTLSMATVIINLAPVPTLIIAVFFFREKITVKKCILMLAAIAGCALVCGLLDSTGGNCSMAGLLFGFAATLCAAIYNVLSKKASDYKYSPITIGFYGLVGCAVINVFIMDWGFIADYVAVNPIGNIAFMTTHAFLVTLMPAILLPFAMVFTEASRAATLCAGTEPLVAMIIGWLVYAEIPTSSMICGMILTIVAMSLLAKPDL